MITKVFKNIKAKSIESILTLLCLCFVAPITACSSSDKEIIKSIGVTELDINEIYDVVYGGTIDITGKGFLLSDIITFTSADGAVYTAEAVAVTDSYLTVEVPDEMPKTGTYTLRVVRDDETRVLGNVTVNANYNYEVPDIEGMNLKGVVYCGLKPLKDVVVSDGNNVTLTDSEGRYYLESDKSTGFVFISIPSGYTPASSIGNTPQFYKELSSNVATIERNDFELDVDEPSDYVVLAMADMHLASRNNDISQYRYGFLEDVNAVIANYEAEGKKVYGITLGDQSWDSYWYSNKYAIADAMEEIYKINCPVFNCMGNHDNDPYIANNDWVASAQYRKVAGPNYYSFNLGKIHYVVLDNIYYINNLATTGSIGDQAYRAEITKSQMEWLKKDLATVTDKSAPLVLCMHIHFHYRTSLSNGKEVYNLKSDNYNTGVRSTNPDGELTISLQSVISEFSDVKLLTGHNHVSYTAKTDNITEYNTASVCATWWWTGKSGYANNHICTDGTPGGYGVWEVSGTTLKNYYKSIGYDRSYQFRAYDRNNIEITAEKYCPSHPDSDLASYAGTYAKASNANEVLINVWGYGPGWSIKVTESGKELPVTQLTTYDPLHIISYTAQRFEHVGASCEITLPSTVTVHMFSVTASSATSTLDITVTDQYGNVYTESMERPKEFSTSMK